MTEDKLNDLVAFRTGFGIIIIMIILTLITVVIMEPVKEIFWFTVVLFTGALLAMLALYYDVNKAIRAIRAIKK